MDELMSLEDAHGRYALTAGEHASLRKRLRNRQVCRRNGRLLYNHEEIIYAIAAMRESTDPAEPPPTSSQWERAKRRTDVLRATSKPCTRCGAQIPAQWVIDRCLACMPVHERPRREAA